MRVNDRQIASYLLLATCAGVSMLGEGLHLLEPGLTHHHSHHHARYIVLHSHHRSAHKHDNAGHDPHTDAHAFAQSSTSSVIELTRGDDEAASHVCGICAFLFEGVSVSADVRAASRWQPLSARLHV